VQQFPPLPIYAAPESDISRAQDVFGFGTLMAIIFSEAISYDQSELTKEKLEFAISQNMNPPILKLINLCWSLDPKHRPTALQLVASLDSLQIV
jgi:hypothetical protein